MIVCPPIDRIGRPPALVQWARTVTKWKWTGGGRKSIILCVAGQPMGFGSSHHIMHACILNATCTTADWIWFKVRRRLTRTFLFNKQQRGDRITLSVKVTAKFMGTANPIIFARIYLHVRNGCGRECGAALVISSSNSIRSIAHMVSPRHHIAHALNHPSTSHTKYW